MASAPPPSASSGRQVLAISCGGTGGHFYPGLSIGLEWQAQGGHTVLLIGGRHKERQLFEAEALGLEAYPVHASPQPASTFKMPFFLGRLATDILRGRRRLARIRADAVLCMGSYTSVPIGLAAALRRTPLILHDGNAHVGRANCFLARWAHTLALAFPPVEGQRLRARTVVVGMPLRTALLEVAQMPPLDEFEREMLCRSLDLEPRLPVLLVFGGSQGAAFINTKMIQALSDWKTPRPFQAVHIAGETAQTELEAAYAAAGVRARVIQFDPRIERYYRLADLLICRAGGSSVAEIALLGKSALMIPFAAAMDNHQKANAHYLVDGHAGMMLTEDKASADAIRIVLARWLLQPDEIARYGDRARLLARPLATADMVMLVRQVMRDPRPPRRTDIPGLGDGEATDPDV